MFHVDRHSYHEGCVDEMTAHARWRAFKEAQILRLETRLNNFYNFYNDERTLVEARLHRIRSQS